MQMIKFATSSRQPPLEHTGRNGMRSLREKGVEELCPKRQGVLVRASRRLSHSVGLSTPFFSSGESAVSEFWVVRGVVTYSEAV